jgi:poly-gamma-glutamate capsule biosynthesis protein CapA/YwtB (metallophosphatase superfamily)
VVGVGEQELSVFLSGDVMLGRAVDQILPNAGDPQLAEPFMRDARAYVDLAEKANGRIPRPVDFAWPWGEALPVLEALAPDVRIVNLETSITRSAEFDSSKSVHYRMSPGNVASLVAGKPDVCALANNHSLDFGRSGLVETLEVLDAAGLHTAGAGRDAREASRPAVVRTSSGQRVTVIAFGSRSSGIPPGWRAGTDYPGIAVGDLRGRSADVPIEQIRTAKSVGDVVVVSIHWGSNWGYETEPEHVELARQLIDAGADVVHGHSSHHPRPIEIYRGRLILYGCGDLINDYEGIVGREEYRDDLRLLYVAALDLETGELRALRIIALQARKMRLEHAPDADIDWLAATLNQISADRGATVSLTPLDTASGALTALNVTAR